METQNNSEQKECSHVRGVTYRWQGYSSSVDPVPLPFSQPVCQAALGTSHGVLLTEGGLVYCFGELPWRRDLISLAVEPILESTLTDQSVVRVSAGSFHCGAITDSGVVYMWGENSHGQCGITGSNLVPDPTPVNILDDDTVPSELVRIQHLACGAQHTLALSTKHEVWAWGSGCQLGLVTTMFPVWKAQKVEHLTGKYVVQIACGEFHSLALVHKLPPSGSNQQSLSKCNHCKQSLYTMIDKDDHVIISDNHYCPLGVELKYGKCDQGSRQESPALTPKEIMIPDLQNSPGLSNSFLSKEVVEGSYSDKTPAMNEPDLDSSKPQVEQLTNSKSSLYPDEQAVKDYLKKISDQSISEQFETISRKGSQPPSRQTSLKSQSSKTILSSLSRDNISNDVESKLLDSASVDLQGSNTTSSFLNSLTDQCTLPVSVSLSDVSSEDSGINRISPCDFLASASLEEVSDESLMTVGNDQCSDKFLEDKRSSSLSNILIEETEESSRRRSLPSLLSLDPPSLLHQPHWTKAGGTSFTNSSFIEKENLLPSLYTEVWSWGRGDEGQLGHGDTLPRLQPFCIKSLNNKEVVKIAAGSLHSLALTAQCEAYSWGCNTYGQLGHMSATTVPQLMQMSDGIRVWDVAGGMTHSVLLADGDCLKPILYYSGEQVQEDSPTGKFTQTPSLLPFCKNLGYVRSVLARGLSCLALADQNVMGFIATLHELASAERKFYSILSKVKKQVLQPLLAQDNVSVYLGKTSTLLFQFMVGHYSSLCHLTGQHATSLTNFLQNSRDVKCLTILQNSAIFIDAYKDYSGPVGNFLVMGGFQALVKSSQGCLGKKLELVKKLLQLKEKNISPNDLLLNLFYMPLQHVQEYAHFLLKLTTCFDVSSVEYHMIQVGCVQFEGLAQLLSKQKKDAENTYTFWKNFSGKGQECLRKPSRRLVCESGSKSLTLQNSGRFSVNRFILFNDALVHAQGNISSKKFFSSYYIYPLATLWVEPFSDENLGLLGLKLTTPEENFTLLASSPKEKGKWLRAINQAVDEVLGVGVDELDFSCSPRKEPPISRTATYTFTKEGRLKNATYSGRWLLGKPHGIGDLKWADGRVYYGTFKSGLEDGFGHYMMPNMALKTFDRYKGHWKKGRIHGFGTYRYATGEVYEGSFQDNLRHGHGMLSSGRLASSTSSVFVGHWVNDKRTGYGIFDDITKGEKYMGMWQDDQRQCSGVVVTQSGLYYEGEFNNNKMMGTGLLFSDEDTAFEGEFSDDWTLDGRGVLLMPNGDSFSGIFQGVWGSELKVSGTFSNLCPNDFDEKKIKTFKVGRHVVSAEEKWGAVFKECWSQLGCETPGLGENERAWENIAVILTTSRREQMNSSEALSRSQCKMLESLEVIPQHAGPFTTESYENFRRYLVKAFDTPLHPLGWLLETLVTVYRMTYVGVGCNRRLLAEAVKEIQSYLRRIFQLVRFLFPGLPEEGGVIPDTSERGLSPCSNTSKQSLIVSSSSLLLPVLLPRLYFPLFALYTLEKEREEEVYTECLFYLNRQPDLSLLTFLGVPKQFWPVSISDLGETKEVLPSMMDVCFATAVDTLQQISLTFTPAGKLRVIQMTFEELTQEVQGMLGQDFMWGMDDLFPVFLYVVLRARIKNLGSEVSLIEDFMDPAIEHGELGLMFTTVKACFYQIQNEKKGHVDGACR